MVTTETVFIGLVAAGMIGAGLVVLNHLLKKREKADDMERLRTMVIPELEKMTMDLMNKTMDMIPDKMGDMVRKITKVQKELEDEQWNEWNKDEE